MLKQKYVDFGVNISNFLQIMPDTLGKRILSSKLVFIELIQSQLLTVYMLK